MSAADSVKNHVGVPIVAVSLPANHKMFPGSMEGSHECFS